jgi:hypothetical protein
MGATRAHADAGATAISHRREVGWKDLDDGHLAPPNDHFSTFITGKGWMFPSDRMAASLWRRSSSITAPLAWPSGVAPMKR